MNFADIHIHGLTGADDGAQSDEMMFRMVDLAYGDGTRLLCLTPHFHLGYFGDNRQTAAESFARLRDYTRERYPDLELCLGNELRYGPDCGSWLQDGLCLTLNHTDLVLVDFSAGEGSRSIIRGLERLMNMGYSPVLAHAERYWELSMGDLRQLHRKGVLLQVNAGSLMGKFGLEARLRAGRLIRERLVSMVATDAHDDRKRPPDLSRACRRVRKMTDPQYAEEVFYLNAAALLRSNQEGLKIDNE